MKNLILLLIGCFAGWGATAQYDQKARTVLDAMSEKYSKISAYKAEITSTMVNESDGIDEKMQGEITVKGNKFILKLDEQAIYNNGQTVWTYLIEANEVNIDNYDPDEEEITPSKIYNAYKKGYKYLYIEEANINSNLCDVIDLVPENTKDTQFFKIKMYISQKDRSLISWVMFEKSGNQYKYEIFNFKDNIQIAESAFTFDPSKYPGVDIIDLR
ncbi:MAG: outer membrane lipoprotein carrier protein LolA [Cyclobacteriaceae bacterium]|nr:outer membrane lipoprotein carrier protein LolA [Cyclobacteriaceae bacterium]